MEKMKAEVTAFRPIFRLLCCRRGLRKNFRGLRPRNLTPKKLSRAVKKLPPCMAFWHSIVNFAYSTRQLLSIW